MKQIDSVDVFDWIEEGRGDPFDPGPEGQMIRDFIPPVFPDYCKIYHPIYADPEPTEAETWDQVEKRASTEDSELAEVLEGATLVYGTVPDPEEKRRVRYEEIAEWVGGPRTDRGVCATTTTSR